MGEQAVNENPKRKLTLLGILGIQAAVVVYTASSICSKMASSERGSIEIFGRTIEGLNLKGFLWILLEVGCLGLYAVLWQQIIKRFDLSIAYCNRAFAVCWSFLWGVLFFGEQVRPLNLVGIGIVLAGILLVNSDAQ